MVVGIGDSCYFKSGQVQVELQMGICIRLVVFHVQNIQIYSNCHCCIELVNWWLGQLLKLILIGSYVWCYSWIGTCMLSLLLLILLISVCITNNVVRRISWNWYGWWFCCCSLRCRLWYSFRLGTAIEVRILS